jgi:hypothetical protein
LITLGSSSRIRRCSVVIAIVQQPGQLIELLLPALIVGHLVGLRRNGHLPLAGNLSFSSLGLNCGGVA